MNEHRIRELAQEEFQKVAKGVHKELEEILHDAIKQQQKLEQKYNTVLNRLNTVEQKLKNN